ncbi:hypothetical protein CH76_11165 [Lysinibacillus sp. BF-4]|uniref:hypothetical protein n=1 Tax=Lysinibacillus sp. BF-4 TaxID=1473546 RepID=UPI0005060588|nr:hypothetical protein [Lysinibacillus sp. BF-4]KFL42630.1 hypothetical protein CH76_11165 [Lysinibacillus sp. BF-4]
MDAQIEQWIKQFQQQKDADALLSLKEHCAVMIEPLIVEFTNKYGEDAGQLLRLKWDKRFHFIFTKYQLGVGLPLESFVQNTYRFYFMQVLRRAGYIQ